MTEQTEQIEQPELSQQEALLEKKQKRIVKFNLYLSCVLLCALVVMLVATTIAYFMDKKQITNTFVSGNVELVLSEAAVKPDSAGNLVVDPDQPRIFGNADSAIHDYGQYGNFYPGQTVYKDPTITNSGSNAAWVAFKVILKGARGDLTQIMGYPGYEEIDIEMLLTGCLLDEQVHVGIWNGIEDVCYNDHYAMIQIPNEAEGVYEFFFLILQPLPKGESVTVFDHVTFPDWWNNAEMQQVADLEILVQAYGVQTMGLPDCLEAMTSAFPEQFPLKQSTIK